MATPYTAAELKEMLDTALSSDEYLLELSKKAAAIRDETMAGREEIEAAFDSVTPCELDPLCSYCGYWRDGRGIPWTIQEAIDTCKYLETETDIRQFHISGGTFTTPEQLHPTMADYVEAIRGAGFDDMNIIINSGADLDDEELQRMANANVKRVFSTFETCDSELFARVKPGDNLEKKQAFAKKIAHYGIGVGTGLMAGLGEDGNRTQGYADSLKYLSDMENLQVVYISKFYPVPGTPMEKHPICPLNEALAMIAVTRLVLPDIHVRASAGWSKKDRLTAADTGAGSIEIVKSFANGKSCFAS